jgi:uracil-DNA glycosylase
LQNIYKEIEADLGVKMPNTGNLDNWSRQGVLLLNATLTVRANQAGSHQRKGWEEFTDAVIKTISDKKNHIVFLLWGRYAQEKGLIIDSARHHILKAPHPSPLSAYHGFFGCKHFSKTNQYLESIDEKPIEWAIHQDL